MIYSEVILNKCSSSFKAISREMQSYKDKDALHFPGVGKYSPNYDFNRKYSPSYRISKTKVSKHALDPIDQGPSKRNKSLLCHRLFKSVDKKESLGGNKRYEKTNIMMNSMLKTRQSINDTSQVQTNDFREEHDFSDHDKVSQEDISPKSKTKSSKKKIKVPKIKRKGRSRKI